MIFVDTNFLIAGLVRQSSEDARLRYWWSAGETITLNVIVWAEFLCGPVSLVHVSEARTLFPHPEPLLPEDAVLGAELFNKTGRRRGSMADCLIAATCLRLNATIATKNTTDFGLFSANGLRMADLIQP